jgi:hypothetical protein
MDPFERVSIRCIIRLDCSPHIARRSISPGGNSQAGGNAPVAAHEDAAWD